MNATPGRISLTDLRFHLIFPLLVFLSIGCASVLSREDLADARSGKSSPAEQSHVVDQVIATYEKMSPTMQNDSVRTLAAIQGEKSTRAMGELLQRPDVQSSKENKEVIQEALLRRGDESSLEILWRSVRNGTLPLDERIVERTGEAKYRDAIPDLRATVEGGRFVPEAMAALAKMKDPDAENYILQVAGTTGHPARFEAIRHLDEIQDRSKVRNLYRSILSSDLEQEDAPLVIASIQGLANEGYDPDSYLLLKRIATGRAREPYRDAALSAMAKMKNVDMASLRDQLSFSLADKQAAAEIWDHPVPGERSEAPAPSPPVPSRPVEEKKETRGAKETVAKERKVDTASIKPVPPPVLEKKVRAKRSVRPVQKTGKKGKGTGETWTGEEVTGRVTVRHPRKNARIKKMDGDLYYSRTRAVLSDALGPDRGAALFFRLNNGLLSYASSDTKSAHFLLRAYQKSYGGEEADMRKRMELGLRNPGCLGAIVDTVLEEYSSRPMQGYAISRLFMIPLWQAQVLIDVVQSEDL